MEVGMSGQRSLLILAACSTLLGAQGTKTSGGGVRSAFAEDPGCSSCRVTIHVDSTLVQLPVIVTDRRGSFVQDLPRSAFRVFEDGVEQEVSAFSTGDVPVSVGLIFDTSGSMQAKLPMARLAIAEFLKTANPKDEFFLLRFDSHPRPASRFTNRTEIILDEVGRAEAGGSTALLDAVYSGLYEMKKAHNPRRLLLIISDGEDNHSRHTESAIHKAERESDIQIVAMGVQQIVFSRRGGRITTNGAALLRDICITTGGRSFEVDDERDLPRIAARIGLEIRNQYLLGYRPSNQNWDGRYRHITLRLMDPSGRRRLKAYWRRGYHASLAVGR
jgi:VWFA-related protein